MLPAAGLSVGRAGLGGDEATLRIGESDAGHAAIRSRSESVHEWVGVQQWKNQGEGEFFGTNLVGADLTDAALGYIVMDGANLTRADLSETSWFRAYITSSVFAYANLSDATFDEATITSSDLTHADLSNTTWPPVSFPTAAVTSSNLSFSTWTDATGTDSLGWRACTCPDLTDSRDNIPAGCVGHLTP